MNSVASNASDGLFSADDELQHWQRVEAEAWGSTPPGQLREIEETPEEGGSRPIAFVALLALVVFAGLWLYTRQPSNDGEVSAKAVVAPAVAREVPNPCEVIAELRAVQADAYVQLLGQDDQSQRLAIIAKQARSEVRLLDQLIEVEPSLTFSAAPVRFRSKVIVDGIAPVESGEQSLDQLMSAADEVAGQAADGDKAIGTYESEQCTTG